MMESQWLVCNEPQEMLQFLKDKEWTNERKLRLFAVECYFRVARQVSESADTWLSTGEMWASGQVDCVELQRALDAAQVPPLLSLSMVEETPAEVAMWAVEDVRGFAYQAGLSQEALQLRKVVDCCLPDFDQPHCHAAAEQERRAQAANLRDLFGPLLFREVQIEPFWRTSAVMALATSIYVERRFEDMPILADAIEDAGCDDEEVLQHLRQGQGHARGCWCLDLILDKE